MTLRKASQNVDALQLFQDGHEQIAALVALMEGHDALVTKSPQNVHLFQTLVVFLDDFGREHFVAFLVGAFGDEREPAAVDFRDETQIIVGRWRALDVFGIRFHGRV